ncbi:MAG TPA: ABC transporter permease [bacterium]|nr:ABC transporter permease [bacterium]
MAVLTGDARRAAPPRAAAWGRLPTGLRYAVIIVGLVGVWETYVQATRISPLLVSSPLQVAAAGWRAVANGQIPAATASTLQELLAGIAVGALAGFAFASAAVFSQIGHDVLSVLIAVMNPLPAIAILPLAMIWFGITPKAIVFVVALATVWPVAINTDAGFRTISPTTRMVARNLGLRGVPLVTGVLLPAALPYILAGLQTAWAFGWRTVVAAELVFGVAGSTGGLGWYINNARYYLFVPDIFAGLIVISVLGIAVDFLFRLIEARTVITWGLKTVR